MDERSISQSTPSVSQASRTVQQSPPRTAGYGHSQLGALPPEPGGPPLPPASLPATSSLPASASPATPFPALPPPPEEFALPPPGSDPLPPGSAPPAPACSAEPPAPLRGESPPLARLEPRSVRSTPQPQAIASTEMESPPSAERV